MKTTRVLAAALIAACASAGLTGYTTLREQNEPLLRRLQSVHGLSDSQMAEVRRIFTKSGSRNSFHSVTIATASAPTSAS